MIRIVLLLLVVATMAFSTTHSQFSKSEKAWLKQNPLVKIAVMNYWPSDSSGESFHTSLLKLLNHYGGLNLVAVPYDSWSEGYRDATHGKKLHGIMGIVKNAQRDRDYFDFSKPYDYIPIYIVVRQEENRINSLDDLHDKTLLVKENSITLTMISEQLPHANTIALTSIEQMYHNLSTQDSVQAIVAQFVEEKELAKYGLKVAKLLYNRYGEISIALHHNYPLLHSIINKTLQKIPAQKLSSLRDRVWDKRQKALLLSDSEEVWIEGNDARIKICVDPNWMPFEKIDKKGNYIGMGAEYMALFEKRLGYPIELVPTKTWSDSLEQIQAKNCDMLPVAMKNNQRKAYLNFTSAYISFPFVIATGKEKLYIEKIEDIIDKPLGIVKDYAYIEILTQKYPTIKLIEIGSVQEGLRMVKQGKLFGFIDALASIAYEIQTNNLHDIKISGHTGDYWQWSIAVRKDVPELLSIAQKFIDSLDEVDTKNINGKWMKIKFEHGFDYTLLWKVLGVVAFIFMLFIFWNRKLSLEIAHRKRIEEELKRAKERAEEATQAKSMFLARMSHEIRTPMNAVLGMLYLTQKTTLTPVQENYIEKAHNAANSLLGVINDILDFSKIEAGKLDIEYVEFDFHEMMSEVGSIMSFKTHDKPIELLITYDETIPEYLISDPTRIKQILINLIGNAIKFTTQGTIIISPKLLKQKGEDLSLQFCVDDSGIGISQNDQAKLFKDFSQVDNSTTRKFGGTGLGLAISKKLSNMLGGDIWLESSSKEEGSTFCFSIQAKEARAKSAEEIIFPESLKHLRILIVDDNIVACQILEDMLKILKIEHIDIVHSGEDAFMKCVGQHQSYDIIFMDYKMEGINGIKSYQRIQTELKEQTPKVVMVSAYSKEDIMKESKEAGIESFLTKPIHPSLLFDAILHTIGKEELISKSQPHNLEDGSLATIKGAKVLLVEDNEINQEFAIMLLEGQGIRLEVANDGLEAIELIQKQSFDLVLMDIEMPNLDGLSAAKKIRAMEDEYYKKVPIVALSAHAMKYDIDKSLAAGMNEHITKPIEPNILFEAMLRYIQPSHIQESVATPKPSHPSLFTLQSELINFQEGIARAGGNEEGYIKVLKRVCNKYKDALIPIKQLIESGELDQAQKKVHELKGVSGNIGAMRLFKIVERVDNDLKASIVPSKIKLQELETILNATFEEVAKVEVIEAQEDAVDFDYQQVLELLDRVADNLEVNIIDSEEALQALNPYLQSTPHRATLDEINHLIENFDTDLALEHITQLKIQLGKEHE